MSVQDGMVAAVSADRNAGQPVYSTRRRVGVGVVLVAGAVVLGVSLSVSPGDTAFYPLTFGLAAVWIVGALMTGPLRAGTFSPSSSARGTVAGAAGLGVAAGVAMGAIFVIGALLTRLIPALSDLVNQVLAFADYGSLPVVVAITLINAVGEEMFFRGSVYSAVRPHHPVVVSTVIYVAATLASGNVMLGFAAVLLGALCALLRRCTGGVLAPVCTHVVWSAIVLGALPRLFG
ncbi:CPBP family intramembrane glutamic endopeptidase [Gordonia sp. NPDC003429]